MFWYLIYVFKFTFALFILPPIYSSRQSFSPCHAPSGTRHRLATLCLHFHFVLYPHFFSSLFNFQHLPFVRTFTFHCLSLTAFTFQSPNTALSKALYAGADGIRSPGPDPTILSPYTSSALIFRRVDRFNVCLNPSASRVVQLGFFFHVDLF